MTTQTEIPTRPDEHASHGEPPESPRSEGLPPWWALGVGTIAFVVVSVVVFALGGAGGGSDDADGPIPKRLAGADRYDTAVAISVRAFPDAAPVVYLTPHDRSPDALAASSLSDGPVLVVPRCGALPEVVRSEIRRLEPDEVIALGGESSVCDDIVRQAVAR